MKLYGIARKGMSKLNSIGTRASLSAASQDSAEVGLYRSPLPHQIEGLDYANGRQKIALFMEMRLGKTLVAIRWAKDQIAKSGFKPQTVYNKTHRVLIVAPLTVLPSWEEELKKEGENEIYWLTGSSAKKLSTSNPFMLERGWFLINYEGLRSCPELFKHSWYVCILDESTKIRNPKAEITKLCNSLLDYVPNKAILSGLPNPESPMDYFEQFRFLYGGFLGINNYWAFRLRFYRQGFNKWDWFPKNGTTEAIKNEVHKLAFVLTRKQAHIGPKKIYEKRHVEMTPKQKQYQKEVEKSFAIEDLDIQTKWVLEKFTWLAHLAGGFVPEKEEIISEEKCKELVNLLTGELKNDKVVIWFRFNRELEYTRKYLSRHAIRSVGITGDNSMAARVRASTDFKTNPETRVMLAQVKCAKFGLDWSVASTAVYYSNSYDMEDRAQSEDRIVHPRKHEPCLYIDLITKDSLDEEIVETLRDKYVNSRVFMMRLAEKWRTKWNKKVAKLILRSAELVGEV